MIVTVECGHLEVGDFCQELEKGKNDTYCNLDKQADINDF
jgi:hypothetical protein